MSAPFEPSKPSKPASASRPSHPGRRLFPGGTRRVHQNKVSGLTVGGVLAYVHQFKGKTVRVIRTTHGFTVVLPTHGARLRKSIFRKRSMEDSLVEAMLKKLFS